MIRIIFGLLLAADWQALFDGKSLNGWEVRPRDIEPLWAVESGAIHVLPRPAGVSEEDWKALPQRDRAAHSSDILTKQSFRDFELQFEFKVAPAGNSGVKYRLQGVRYAKPGTREFVMTTEWASAPSFQTVGFEYQVADDQRTRDSLSSPRNSAASLYDILAPKKSKPVLADVWHIGRIIATGTHIEHWIDGEKVIDTDLASAEFKAAFADVRARRGDKMSDYRRTVVETLGSDQIRESPIALQHHTTEAWFRNLKIRRLD